MADELKFWSDGLPVELFDTLTNDLKYWVDGVAFVQTEEVTVVTSSPPKRRIFIID